MSLKRILGFALILGLTLPLVACDDVTKPPPPPPARQIDVVRHYKKAVDSDGRTQVGLQSNDVYDMFVTSGGSLWVGNQEGIAVFDDVNNTRRSAAYDQNNGLPNPKVRCVVESNGILYVGTWGGGIGAYDIGAGTWTILDVASGLVNNLVADMQVDTDGAIIIATNDGVSRYNPANGNFTSYKKEAAASTIGDLLDPYVSAIAIASTPRGKEYWYMPRWESGITPGTEATHGITIALGAFNAPTKIDTIQVDIDNTLYENATGNRSNGLGQTILAGTRLNGQRLRALLRFDVASVVPSDATVISARLRFRNLSTVTVPARISLHRVTSNWGEGTSDAASNPLVGAVSTAGDATWLHTFYPGATWNSQGGDFIGTSSGGIEVRNSGAYNLTRPAMADDVQRWLNNPASNFGWLIQNPDSVKQFASGENATASFRPTLEVSHSRFIYMTEVNTDLPAPNVNDIVYDPVNDLFYIAFSTYGIGVVDVSASTWSFFTTDHGLPSNVVYSITIVDGVVWAGTQNGLARQLPDGSFRSYNRAGGLPGDRVRDVYSDRPDRLWIGHVSAGGALLDPASAE